MSGHEWASKGMASVEAGQARNGNGNGRHAERLKSWKEIANFFGADERTVRRWEKRGLPIHRVPGDSRSTVFAEVADLESWLRQEGRAEAMVGGPPAPSPWRLRFTRARVVLGSGVLAAVVLVASGAWLSSRQAQLHLRKAAQASPTAVNLQLSATYESDRMTLDGERRAISLFGQAIAEDPTYADPYAGLANAWLRLRTFGAVSEVEAYRRARAAAERALELNPNLPAAHSTMGFIRFYRDWDFDQGLAHFRRVSELDPRTAAGHHSYGMALLHMGRFDEALEELDKAQRLDPRSRSMRAERSAALYFAGRKAEGKALLQQMAGEDPDFVQPHLFLYQVDFAEGEYAAALDHAGAAARLAQNPVIAAQVETARRALARGGGHAMLTALLRTDQDLNRQGQVSTYAVAQVETKLGQRGAALASLKQSLANREPEAILVRVDPALDSLRSDPGYRKLLSALSPSS
jgi:tetratricopeptide (TPR) repeat protein